MKNINSSQNGRIKRLIQLHRSRGRLKQKRIAVFGEREIERAISCGVLPDELFICTELANEIAIELLRSRVPNFDKVSYVLSADLFDKVCFGSRSDGIVMTAERPVLAGSDFVETEPDNHQIVAVVESIEKPGNLGAIMRSIDGAGIDGLIVANAVTDWFHPNTIRSSLGTCFSIPGWIGESESILQRLVGHGFQIVVASLQAKKSLYDLDLKDKTAVVLGSEADGVSEVWRKSPCLEVALPMHGIADSLNVSVAAAVMFYEARRQRQTNRSC